MLFSMRVRRLIMERPPWLAYALWGLMAAVVALLLLTATGHADQQPVVSEELLRLHVIANSDSPADQAIKLQVRDAIQRAFAAAWQEAPSGGTCRAWARRDARAIEACANDVLAEAGFAYTAHVEVGVYDFPERTYEDTVQLPAGRYWGVRVMLGEAAGQNWWCVLYPPLCAPAEDGQPQVRSWVWEHLPASWQRCLANFWIGKERE